MPLAASTKQVLDASALLFQKLAATESLEKQQELVEKIREEESQILEDDAVYVQVSEYIQAIAGMNAGAETGSDGGPGSEAASGVGDAKVLLGRTLGGQQPLIEVVVDIEDVDDEEDEINRVGDVLFKDSSGSGGGFSPLYTKKWSHIGLYSGSGRMYDSHPDNCAGTNDDGVGRRPLSRLYDEAESVMYSQLANSSWRSSEPGALEDAEDAYGTNCQTPFTRLWFDMSSTSKFFCSKLVWRIYLDNDDHSVDLNSNHYSYFLWLIPRFSVSGALYILYSTVAPDEIARSSHLNHYRTLN